MTLKMYGVYLYNLLLEINICEARMLTLTSIKVQILVKDSALHILILKTQKGDLGIT